MTTVPLGVGAYERVYGQEPVVELKNRFFEQTPTNQVEGLVLLARPGDTVFTSAGDGPISIITHQPGAFEDDLFFVSGEQLFRFDGTTTTAITGTITTGTIPSITFVTGAAFEHLFITDGVLLQLYTGTTSATGTLTVSAIAAGDTIELGGTYYEWVTAGTVDTGSPVGTEANPWRVSISTTDTLALANLILALNASGTAGTSYTTSLTIHLTVEGTSSSATTLVATARTAGTAGNSISSTDPVDSGGTLAWAATTLAGGGVEALVGVATPDDRTFVSLTTLNSFAVLVQSLSDRFYWIQPGATTIDALDFATAESEPDEIIEIKRIGDVMYMFGQSSTEVWYSTGEADTPFRPTKGLAFSQGVLEGTAVAIRTQAITIAEDGVVYQIVGGPQRISNNGIEERIRLFRKALGV